MCERKETKLDCNAQLADLQKPVPDLKIECYGRMTVLTLKGYKLQGVESIVFKTDARADKLRPVLELTIDVKDFRLDQIKE